MKRIMIVFFSLVFVVFPSAVFAQTLTENHPPVISAPTIATSTVNALLSFMVSASDPDGDTVTLMPTDLPAGAEFVGSSNEFRWTPTEAGTAAARFSATDRKLIASHSVVLAVEKAGNRSPEFTGFNPLRTAHTNTAYSYDVNAADPDGDVIIFRLIERPEGMSIATSTGLITWTPNTTTSPQKVTVEVSDGVRVTQASYWISLGCTPHCYPQIITHDAVVTTVGSLVEFSAATIDPDGEAVQFFAALPDGAVFASSTQMFSWRPTSVGAFSAFFAARDNDGTTIRRVAITVNESGPAFFFPTIVGANPMIPLLPLPTPRQGTQSGTLFPAEPHVPSQPTTNSPPAVRPPGKSKPAGTSTGVSTTPTTTGATSSVTGGGLFPALFAGVDLPDWIGPLGWLLWIITLIVFLAYVYSVQRRERDTAIPSSNAGDEYTESLFREAPTPESDLNDYWETSKQEKDK